MKELTIEQKAKRYEEAINVAMSKIKNDKDHVLYEDVKEIFPELKESEDERVSKALIHLITEQDGYLTAVNGISTKDILAWLEKQGEQKPVIEGTFVNVDEVRDDFMQEVYRALYSDSTNDRANQIIDAFDHLPTITIQKPADKVEPKFKVGEWVIFNENHNSAYQVERIDNYSYYLRHYLGGSLSVHFDNELIRKWTIQDAKAGDVLHSPSHRLIWIYKDNEHYHACVNMNYVTENVATDGLINTPNDACPATKDEQTILSAKLKEAGYEWDAEKKELKKIENEIEIPFHAEIDDDKVVIKKGEKPAEWSEEDEKIYQSIMDDTVQENQLDSKQIDWLKSLKERYTWKPNEEQMKALNYVVNLMASSKSPNENDYYYNVFKDLRKQIKKLREE